MIYAIATEDVIACQFHLTIHVAVTNAARVETHFLVPLTKFFAFLDTQAASSVPFGVRTAQRSSRQTGSCRLSLNLLHFIHALLIFARPFCDGPRVQFRVVEVRRVRMVGRVRTFSRSIVAVGRGPVVVKCCQVYVTAIHLHLQSRYTSLPSLQ